MKRSRSYAAIVAALAAGLIASGCGVTDPTENSGPMTFRNDLSATAKISYCEVLSCSSFFWTDSIRSRQTSSDSVVADGTRSRFVVMSGGQRSCITLNLTRALAEEGLDIRRSALRRC